MPLATTILPALDTIRGIRGVLGLSPFNITQRTVTWTGGSPGLGTKTVVDTVLLIGQGQNPNMVQVTNRDIALSGGVYLDQDIKVGPFTPQYTGGGMPYTTLQTGAPTVSQEFFFRIAAPHFAQPRWYKRIGDIIDSSLHIYIVIRTTAETP